MGYVAAVAWTLTGLELRLATETGAPPTSVRGGRRRGEGSTYVTGHGDVTQSRPAGARCLESTDDTDDPHNYKLCIVEETYGITSCCMLPATEKPTKEIEKH